MSNKCKECIREESGCLLCNDYRKYETNISDCPCTLCLVTSICTERCELFLNYATSHSIDAYTNWFYEREYTREIEKSKDKTSITEKRFCNFTKEFYEVNTK